MQQTRRHTREVDIARSSNKLHMRKTLSGPKSERLRNPIVSMISLRQHSKLNVIIHGTFYRESWACGASGSVAGYRDASTASSYEEAAPVYKKTTGLSRRARAYAWIYQWLLVAPRLDTVET